jgi:hypothetical protein
MRLLASGGRHIASVTNNNNNHQWQIVLEIFRKKSTTLSTVDCGSRE